MAVKTLATWIAAGWLHEHVGYYRHEGYLYVTGRLESQTEPPYPTTHLLSGLPAALRPNAPTRITLVAGNGSDYPLNKRLNPPRYFGSTVYPNGLWILDFLPRSVRETPSGWYFGVAHEPQYTRPLFLELILGNARWPLAPLADAHSSKPLAKWVNGAAFGDGASGYALHNTRVHLDGSVTRLQDDPGAVDLFLGFGDVPEGAEDVVPPNDYTTALVGGNPVPLLVQSTASRFEVTELGDHMKPASDSPPLVPWSGFGAPRTTEEGGWIPTNFGAGEGTRTVEATRRGVFHECCAKVIGPPPHIACSSCPSFAPVPTLTLTPEEILAEVSPPPDWYLMVVLAFDPSSTGIGEIEDGSDGCVGGIALANCTTSEGMRWQNDIHRPKLDGAAATVITEGAVVAGAPLTWWALQAPEPLYKGAPLLSNEFAINRWFPGPLPEGKDLAPYIWHISQPAPLLNISWDAEVHRIRVRAEVRMMPFWEARQWGLHLGDVLDLTHSGWPSPQSVVDIGPGAGGVALKAFA